MHKNITKVLAAFLSLLLIALTLTSCGKADNSEDERPALVVWVYSDEYKVSIERAINSAFTSIDWRVEVEVIGSEELDLLLSGENEKLEKMPDVFMLSPDNLCSFVNSDITIDLGSLGIAFDNTRYYGYTIEAGTDSEGILKAACYEPDPGLFFYRRSLAKYYLGTDDPDQIQDMISDWDGFYETAKLLSSASNGDTRIAMGVDEIMMAYLSGTPLVVDGKLSIGTKANEFMDYCSLLASEDLIYNAEQWSEAWVAGISDPKSVFGYFSSGLGMENVLKPCSGGTIANEGSYGDWAAVPGPAAFNWGGCWFAVHHDSDMIYEATVFIEYFTCEEEAMRTDRLISGSFSANRTVVDQIKFDPQFSESFLSAQNCYNLMSQTADDVTMSHLTEYDQVIRPLFAQCTADFAFGYSTREQALSVFERTAYAAFPELSE